MPAPVYALLLLIASGLTAFGETAADHAVQLSARVSGSPLSIKLLWIRNPDAIGYTVARKLPASASWSALATLPATATQYLDQRVAAGVEYEYRVIKVAQTYKAYGFISAAISKPVAHERGKLILLVESSQAAPLASELARLQQDLTGDGWTVLRRDVARTASAASVKEVVMTEYRADPAKVKTLFIFGHVPVPYSGNFAPDEHGNHVGAWPADVFYGIDSDAWSDEKVNNPHGADVRTRNVPGDGKFDQSYLPANVKLQIGRVDLANLFGFAKNETELLRQYLNKNHAFRIGALVPAKAGLVGDRFGVGGPGSGYPGEAFAANGWAAFAALLGAGNVKSGSFYPVVIEQSKLLAYACGGGSYTNVADLATTSQFAGQTSRAAFVAMFGSYFGDWDSPDNLLRAPLANDGHGLASMWAGRPFWVLHPLGLGQTLGYCARLTQNNTTLYPAGKFARGVHVALMGDPTLRLHAVPQPKQLAAARVSTGVKLTWQAPAVPPNGYHVYRSADPAGPYVRISKALVHALTFTDTAPLPSPATYQVRSARLQATNGGSYWNNSVGAFVAAP